MLFGSGEYTISTQRHGIAQTLTQSSLDSREEADEHHTKFPLVVGADGSLQVWLHARRAVLCAHRSPMTVVQHRRRSSGVARPVRFRGRIGVRRHCRHETAQQVARVAACSHHRLARVELPHLSVPSHSGGNGQPPLSIGDGTNQHLVFLIFSFSLTFDTVTIVEGTTDDDDDGRIDQGVVVVGEFANQLFAFECPQITDGLLSPAVGFF